jgi:hypothetical protein
MPASWLQDANLLILCGLHCVLAPPQAPSCQRHLSGAGKRRSACPSSTKLVGQSERSRSTGCTSPASAKFGTSGTVNEADGAAGERNGGRHMGQARAPRNKQSLLGEAGGGAPGCRLQQSWSKRRWPPNNSTLPLHDTPQKHLAVKGKMTALVVSSCMSARPNSPYAVTEFLPRYIY